MKPYFSIIIPTYNRANVLKDTIKSVLQQKFQNWELLIVDDGSTDRTRELVFSILSVYAKYKEKIVYLYLEKNMGMHFARFVGAINSRGDLLVFLDSDNCLLPDALYKISNITRQVHSDLYFFRCKDKDTGKILSSHPSFEGFLSYKRYLCQKIKGEHLPVVRRDAYLKIAEQISTLRRSGIGWLLIAKKSKKIFISKEIVALYRVKGEDSLTGRKELLFDVYKFIIKNFWKDYLKFCPQKLIERILKLMFYYLRVLTN